MNENEIDQSSNTQIKAKKLSAKKLIIGILTSVIVACLLSLVSIFTFCYFKYQSGIEMLENENFCGAAEVFSEFDDVEGSKELLNKAYYGIAEQLFLEGKHNEALAYFQRTNGFSDSEEKISLICEYLDAVKLLDNKDYEKAIEAFSSLSEVPGANDRICEANYKIALNLYSDSQYLDAIECFTKSDGYKDSAEKIQNCYYNLGVSTQIEGDYEKSIEYFNLAGYYSESRIKIKKSYYELGLQQLQALEFDKAKESFAGAGNYEDAEEYLNAADYYQGHYLFLAEKYDEAKTYFEKTSHLTDAKYLPHFKNMTEAEGFLRKKGDELAEGISVYIGEMPEGITTNADIMMLIYNYLPVKSVFLTYNETTKLLLITPVYYPGHRIVYAHENGKTDILTEEEKVAYNKALFLVEQAKNESGSELELELWLHDWICNNTIYDSPDLTNAYYSEESQYRQLNCIGTLIDGKANCQGYADTFYLLASLAGFDTRIVGSDTHAWNAISINDNWYMVDCTFNDINDSSVAKTYIWFNSPFDAEQHMLVGDFETFPWVNQVDDYSVTYYDLYNCLFYDANSAIAYMAQQNITHGYNWTYVMIKGQEVSWSYLSSALNTEVEKYFYGYKNWVEYCQYVNGNTYFTVFWY